MADVPHQRSLVKRLEGKPFVILGINSDRDRQELKKVIETNQITWRSWWDGGGTKGPIASTWNIKAWPSLYLLDQKGVIRYMGDDLRGITIEVGEIGTSRQVDLLDKAVDALLKEFETAKGGQGPN